MSWKELKCSNKRCKGIIGHIKDEIVIYDRILASKRNVYIACPECKRVRKIFIDTRNNYLKYLTNEEKTFLISEN